MIVSITISRGLFVFSQSRFKVSSTLTNVGSRGVEAFDPCLLLDWSLSLNWVRSVGRSVNVSFTVLVLKYQVLLMSS